MKPVPGLLQQVFVALFFCFLTVGGGVVGGVGTIKLIKMYAPVLVYNAPSIDLPAPIDNCNERQVLDWDSISQRWFCLDTLEDINRDIRNSDSYYRHLSNIGIFARASGQQVNSWALVTDGNTQLGTGDDTVTINGRLVVNGVDITPKIPKSKNTRPLSGPINYGY